MNTALIDSQKAQLKAEERQLQKSLKRFPADFQKTVERLSGHSESEIAQIQDFIQEYLALKARKQFLDTFTQIPKEMQWVMGKPYDWPQLWLDRLTKTPLKNLGYLPYKQCHWCGQGIERAKGKSFCKEEHAQEFRQWRDNARRVGKTKSPMDRDAYYLYKVEELYREKKPPRLRPVVFAAYQMAYQWLYDNLRHSVPDEWWENPINTQPRVHHIVRKLLKHYQSRRVLEFKADPGIYNISPKDVPELLMPSSFMTDEYLMMK